MHTCGRCRIPLANRKYWIEKLERNAARDQRNLRRLRRDGWRVLTIWECSTARTKRDQLQHRIQRFLAKQ
jgi:DNA mismatch endonuclease, patch repair protein